MNKIPNDTVIITDIVGDSLKIMVAGQYLVNKMKSMGFSYSGESMVLAVSDEQDKDRIISGLINEGAVFLYGHGWYPSEVMEYYKEQGKNFGKYKIIYWTDADTYCIEER